MFCGLPNGVKADPTLAAIATKVTDFERSISATLYIAMTSGTNTNMAVSFIITADEKDTMRAVIPSNPNSVLEDFTKIPAILPKNPDSSSPLEITKKERMVARLS